MLAIFALWAIKWTICTVHCCWWCWWWWQWWCGYQIIRAGAQNAGMRLRTGLSVPLCPAIEYNLLSLSSFIMMMMIMRSPLPVIFASDRCNISMKPGVWGHLIRYDICSRQQIHICSTYQFGVHQFWWGTYWIFKFSPEFTLSYQKLLINIPHICHFFTQSNFLENKICTEKLQFFALIL